MGGDVIAWKSRVLCRVEDLIKWWAVMYLMDASQAQPLLVSMMRLRHIEMLHELLRLHATLICYRTFQRHCARLLISGILSWYGEIGWETAIPQSRHPSQNGRTLVTYNLGSADIHRPSIHLDTARPTLENTTDHMVERTSMAYEINNKKISD
jgi:hypothetical protein